MRKSTPQLQDMACALNAMISKNRAELIKMKKILQYLT